jgi:hypothetical protein
LGELLNCSEFRFPREMIRPACDKPIYYMKKCPFQPTPPPRDMFLQSGVLFSIIIEIHILKEYFLQ